MYSLENQNERLFRKIRKLKKENRKGKNHEYRRKKESTQDKNRNLE